MRDRFKKIAFLFPGQGAQYVGMAGDFVKNFAAARLVFEEADDLLKRSLSKIISEGPEKELLQTKNSQTGIFVAGIAILRVVQEMHGLAPFACAGLSLGEYTALTAGGWMAFRDALPLVQHRGELMNEACEVFPGTMSVVMGCSGAEVDDIVNNLKMPNDIWVANYNCPGQVVISGTFKGVEAATAEALKKGAKRVLPLSVYGAFHSGLMQGAEKKLEPYILNTPIKKGVAKIVMNVPGDFVSDLDTVRLNLIKQVTGSVRWEQEIRALEQSGVDLFIEFGPGKTLTGLNKRIGVKVPIISIDKLDDLEEGKS